MTGKNKGNRFERKVAKKLSLWLTEGGNNTQLIRSVQSGGWSERQDNQIADLAPNGSRGKEFLTIFAVECKATEKFNFFHVWSSTKPKMYHWWVQVDKEASAVNRVPLVVYSKNYYPNLVVLPTGLALQLYPEARMMTIRWPDLLDNTQVSVLELDYFLTVDSDLVIKRGKEYLESR